MAKNILLTSYRILSRHIFSGSRHRHRALNYKENVVIFFEFFELSESILDVRKNWKGEKRTHGIFPGHVLSGRGLSLFDAQIWNVERWSVHVVGTVLVTQWTVSLGTR